MLKMSNYQFQHFMKNSQREFHLELFLTNIQFPCSFWVDCHELHAVHSLEAGSFKVVSRTVE